MDKLASVTVADLVQRARGGDRDAEAELCRRFAPRVRMYGQKHLRDDDRARELVQAVLIAVLEAVRGGRVEDPERFDRFVLGTCRNLTGRARYADTRAQPTDVATLAELVATTDPPELDVVALLRCMQGVELRVRTVLHLTFYRDMSADEIATALSTTAGNVRVLRHRGVAQLRDCMEASA